MSFKLALSETYPFTVTVNLPGEKAPRKFDLFFHRKTQSEMQALAERAADLSLDDKGFCRQVVAGWDSKQVTDADGEPVEFCADALEALLDIYPIPSSIVVAFYESTAGAKTKNYLPPQRIGRAAAE